MRRDSMQFDAAMILAKAHDVEQIPYISASNAEQLEFTLVIDVCRASLSLEKFHLFAGATRNQR
jgi:hypothetical protein